MKDQPSTKKNSQSGGSQPSKKPKYNKPQVRPASQNSFAGFHYNMAGPQFNTPFAQGMAQGNPNYKGKNFIPNYKPMTPNPKYPYNPRQSAPNPPPQRQNFQKKAPNK